MDLRSYLSVVRRNAWIIILAFALGVAGGVGMYMLKPRVYASSVTFYISTPVPSGSSPLSVGEFAQQRISSYVELLESQRLARAVIIESGVVGMTPTEVMHKITASGKADTVLVTATVRDQSQERAQKLAAGISTAFGPMVDELDNAGRDNGIVVVNTISGPSELGQVSPDKKKYLGLGILGGAVLAGLVVAARELLDNAVRDSDAISTLIGAPVIGTIPFEASARRSPLIIGDERASIRAEAYRQLRTNIEFFLTTRKSSVFAITSSVAGESKTTTVVNLGLALVEAGKRVLIVEGDLRRPKIANYLSLEKGVGLTNVLVGNLKVEAVIQQYGTRDLYFLASGPTPPNPAELLGSDYMLLILDALRDQYDIILIDVPPLLPVTDAAVVSTMADAAILTVRHGRTTQYQVSEAVQSLNRVGVDVLGSVVTMKKVRQRRAYRYEGSAILFGGKRADAEVVFADWKNVSSPQGDEGIAREGGVVGNLHEDDPLPGADQAGNVSPSHGTVESAKHSRSSAVSPDTPRTLS